MTEAVRRARGYGYLLQVQCEVSSLKQLQEAIEAGVDRVLLDNMSNDLLAQAVQLRDRLAPRVSLEASGNMTLGRLKGVAATGVDFISVGGLTHSAPSLDISLDVQQTGPDRASLTPIGGTMTQPHAHQHLMQLRPLLSEVELLSEIARLRVERNAVILAHNYQRQEVQAIADYVGDSLGLSRQAAATDADVIVFAGVHFMAETAAILNPGKTVLLPDANAGCSLADTLSAADVLAWRASNPDGLVVVYVNTTADVKAEADYCVTSGNAVQIVASLPEGVPVLFAPDRFLAAHVERQTGRKLDIWQGACHVHESISPAQVDAARSLHPDAELLIHPECGCTSHVLAEFPDLPLYSTEGMVHRAQNSAAQEFVVVTELGMVHRLEHDVPGKTFYPVHQSACCEYMKMTTLENVYEALRDMTVRVTVDPGIAALALTPIGRMLAMG